MHNILKAALPEAKGVSESVFTIVADIRGFSKFSLLHESPDVAMYIKYVYMKLIGKYFPFASFYKTTGDGLLMTVKFDEGSLRKHGQASVEACLQCLEDFPNICEADSMINFETPSQIGFGLARGPACCLISNDMVLDYSGQLLNLASRLADLARPAGIVIDGQFGMEILSEPVREQFEPANVYVRSVAEEEPREVYIQKDVVELPPQALSPLSFEDWQTLTVTHPFREWRVRAPQFLIDLPAALKRPDGIEITVHIPHFAGGKHVGTLYYEFTLTTFTYRLLGGKPRVQLNLKELIEFTKRKKVPLRAPIELNLHYIPKD